MNVKQFASKLYLKARAHRAEIAMGAGAVLGLSALVTTAIQTTKAGEVIERHNEAVKQAHEAREVVLRDGTPDEYTEADEKKNVFIAYRNTGWSMIKLYALPAALWGASTACFFAAYGWLKSDIAALSAAYSSLLGCFRAYRGRVREDQGEEKDYQYLYGTSEVEVGEETTDEKGKKKFIKKKHTILGESYSPYAFIFDETNPDWNKDPFMNKNHIQAVESMLNDMLITRGVVTLNEVRDAFCLPPISIGMDHGWVKNSPDGDGRIVLGLFSGKQHANDFVNGFNDSIVLDPNCDGYIKDKI